MDKIGNEADYRKDFEEIVERLEGCLENETGLKRIAEAKEYILSNWTAAKLRLRHQNGVKGSSTQILTSEKKRHGEIGKYVEAISHSIPLQNKKIVYFNAHIWGL